MSARPRPVTGRPAAPRGPELHVAWAVPQDHRRLDAWLDGVERSRVGHLGRREDRDRFTTSRALVKRLVATVADVDAGTVSLDYGCPRCGRPHGRPVVVAPDAARGLHVSISHAGGRVLVAASAAGPVGVDVEPVGAASFAGFASVALTAAESAVVDRVPAPGRDLARTTYWVRKEAVLKAAGRGLRQPATDVEVSAPHEPPRVIGWPDGPDPTTAVHLHDVDVGEGYLGCAAALADARPWLRVREDVSIDLVCASPPAGPAAR
ncbi:MAG: 4'-phosphopantetheinyl transferase family protein [Actinomycetes bacterium]